MIFLVSRGGAGSTRPHDGVAWLCVCGRRGGDEGVSLHSQVCQMAMHTYTANDTRVIFYIGILKMYRYIKVIFILSSTVQYDYFYYQ